MKEIDYTKFFIPFALILITLFMSFFFKEEFIHSVSNANHWILSNFGWLFSWTSFLVLFLLIAVYFSSIGKVKIGGINAQPILSKWRWFAITICTTIATGILFWGSAEPLYHFRQPPLGLNITGGSDNAVSFTMGTMFMHWTFTPYGIYTIISLLFALVFYNLKQSFSLGSIIFPLTQKSVSYSISTVIDIICLYALIAGMSASLGAGILTIAGGLDTVLGIEQNTFILSLICLAIVGAFIISASSGLQKGIRILSNYNVIGFIIIAVIIVILGPISDILTFTYEGIVNYVSNFFKYSVNTDGVIDPQWRNEWTTFYWANWMAWAPITALFLGKISIGYTVREFIHYNLIIPSLFGMIWMGIFSSTSISLDILNNGSLFNLLESSGEQKVIFAIFNELNQGIALGIFFIILTYLSFVTAADSNTTAMSNICTKGTTAQAEEPSLTMKIAWGIFIGVMGWMMVSYTGIQGVKMLSVLGGFPALFLIIIAFFSLFKLVLNPKDLL